MKGTAQPLWVTGPLFDCPHEENVFEYVNFYLLITYNCFIIEDFISAKVCFIELKISTVATEVKYFAWQEFWKTQDKSSWFHTFPKTHYLRSTSTKPYRRVAYYRYPNKFLVKLNNILGNLHLFLCYPNFWFLFLLMRFLFSLFGMSHLPILITKEQISHLEACSVFIINTFPLYGILICLVSHSVLHILFSYNMKKKGKY